MNLVTMCAIAVAAALIAGFTITYISDMFSGVGRNVVLLIGVIISVAITTILVQHSPAVPNSNSGIQNTAPEQNSINTTINIPDGYKFVAWVDEAKTSYVIEDTEGNQQVIIIED